MPLAHLVSEKWFLFTGTSIHPKPKKGGTMQAIDEQAHMLEASYAQFHRMTTQPHRTAADRAEALRELKGQVIAAERTLGLPHTRETAHARLEADLVDHDGAGQPPRDGRGNRRARVLRREETYQWPLIRQNERSFKRWSRRPRRRAHAPRRYWIC